MKRIELERGAKYGIAFQNTTSVDALMKLIQSLNKYDIDDLLILPYRVGDSSSSLTKRLDALSIEGFRGVIAISVLGISHTDDALFACLNLRDALNCPELTIVVVASSERKTELAKVLAIAGFSDLPERSAKQLAQ